MIVVSINYRSEAEAEKNGRVKEEGKKSNASGIKASEWRFDRAKVKERQEEISSFVQDTHPSSLFWALFLVLHSVVIFSACAP